MFGFFNPFGSVGSGGQPTPQPTNKILYNTTAYWNSQADQITEAGTLYIYSDAKDYNGNKVPRLKIGNGILSIGEMPFIDQYYQPTEPIYIDPPREAIVDDGEQDIFTIEPDEIFSFSGRVGTSVDNEKLILTY